MLLDLDGCVWVGGTPTRGAPEAIAELRAAGKALAFLTNDSRRSPEEYVRKLWSLGSQASLEEVVTVGRARSSTCSPNRPGGAGAFVIGSRRSSGTSAEPGQRIVNGTERGRDAESWWSPAHDEFDYAELRDATQAVLGRGRDDRRRPRPHLPDADGLWPGHRAIVAALEYATEPTARIVGKPEPQIFLTALDRLGPGRALVIGDRLDSDLAGAAAAGLDGAIVLTGVTTRAAGRGGQDPAPVAVAEDLHALLIGTMTAVA